MKEAKGRRTRRGSLSLLKRMKEGNEGNVAGWVLFLKGFFCLLVCMQVHVIGLNLGKGLLCLNGLRYGLSWAQMGRAKT